VFPEYLKDEEYRIYARRFAKAVEDNVEISEIASRLLKDSFRAALDKVKKVATKAIRDQTVSVLRR
jgi:hypothetical protein